MDNYSKTEVKKHLQSIAIQAVQAQSALDDDDYPEVRDLFDGITHDLERIETIGKEALEVE